jgi:dTDP-4-dehydrorhamnose reductase
VRILVLGGGGMLGHKMVQALSRKDRDTWWTLRGGSPIPFLPLDRCIEGVDVRDWSALHALLVRVRPDVIVNCAGVIKQRHESQNPITSLTVNALLPHLLAEAAAAWGGRLVHFSTDCVFSGRKGAYTEADVSDAEDLYGRTKFLGEVAGPNVLTLRTSIIGREVKHHQSLLDWFLLGAHTRVPGYRRVWWSGVTTNHLAGLVGRLIERHPSLSGLYQVSSERISKYDLLCMVRNAFDVRVDVEPDDGPANDHSLDGSRFAKAVGYQCPPWEQLIAELVNDPTPYNRQPQRPQA